MNSFNPTDVTEQYLSSVTDNFQKELHRLMQSSYNTSDNIDEKREKETQKQIALLNGVIIQLLKLKNFRRKMSLSSN